MRRARGIVGPPRVLCLDKAAGPTSFQAVRRVRGLFGYRRVGHAGTLDPFATGVLVIGLGAATRLLTHLGEDTKRYLARVRFGEARVGHDPTGEVTATGPVDLDETAIRRALSRFEGEVEQVPPRLSAIKIDGKRSYARFRDGETEASPASRRVTFHRIELLDIRGHDVELDVECSGGTYIRALARDLGVALDTPAHLAALRRTAVGPFTLDEAVAMPDDDVSKEEVRAHLETGLLAPEMLVRNWPRLTLDAERCEKVRHGLQPTVDWWSEGGLDVTPGRVALMDPQQKLVAVVRVEEEQVLRLKTVLAPAEAEA